MDWFGEYRATPLALTEGMVARPQVDAAGRLITSGALTDSSGVALTQNGGIRLAGPAAVSRLSSSAATVNATLVKAASARLFKITGTNKAATDLYLKLFNKATAPVPGTDFPFWVETLEASSSFEMAFPSALYLSNGLGYAIMGGAGDLDATAIAAGDIVTMNVAYL